MAATSGASDEDLHLQKESCRNFPNNNGTSVESCKDLLRVCPELGLEKYRLKKNGHRTGLPRMTFKPSACEALKQVKDFLPVMKNAQQELLNDDLNIENVDEEKPYINMDVQFFELEVSESSTAESESESSNCSGSGSEESCGEEKFNIGEVTTKNFVITKPHGGKKPLIEDVT